MKTRTTGYLIILLFSCWNASAQLQLVSATGDRLTGENMTLNFSLGEVAVGTLSTNQRMLTQGFYQPAFTTTSTEGYQPGHIHFYPNPVDQTLFIQIHQDLQANYEFEVLIYDLYGKVIDFQILATTQGGDYRIDLGHYPPGIYLMNMQSRDKAIITTHKIIKQ